MCWGKRLNAVTDIDGVGGASDCGVVNIVGYFGGDEGCPNVDGLLANTPELHACELCDVAREVRCLSSSNHIEKKQLLALRQVLAFGPADRGAAAAPERASAPFTSQLTSIHGSIPLTSATRLS